MSAVLPAAHPAIVLVRPQLGENIGKAARAMLNFGLTDLRLVAPRDGWPNPQAGPAASGADVVLERARVFDSVAAAVADCAHVYATTVRKRGVTKPVLTPEAAAAAIHADAGGAAILFGPERSGLETDDVALARTIVTVPINPEFGSLNLAQAVILVAYEWSKGQNLASPPEVTLDPPAAQEELEGMIGQLDAMLQAAHFFYPPDRTVTVRRSLRTLLTKTRLVESGGAHAARRAVGARRREAREGLGVSADRTRRVRMRSMPRPAPPTAPRPRRPAAPPPPPRRRHWRLPAPCALRRALGRVRV